MSLLKDKLSHLDWFHHIKKQTKRTQDQRRCKANQNQITKRKLKDENPHKFVWFIKTKSTLLVIYEGVLKKLPKTLHY
jgi:hypothetical protein